MAFHYNFNTRDLVNRGIITDPSDFTVPLQKTLQLDSLRYEVAITSFSGWNADNNFDQNYNMRWSHDNGSSWINVPIPNGKYSVEDLDVLLQKSQYAENKVDLDPTFGNVLFGIRLLNNSNTNKMDITIDNDIQSSANTFLFDLSDAGNPSNPRLIFGFGDGVVSASQSSSSIPNFSNNIDRWYLVCDWVNQSFVNGLSDKIIFDFLPIVGANKKFDVNINNFIWYQISESTKQTIRFKLVDNLGRKIDLNGENHEFRLTVRSIK